MRKNLFLSALLCLGFWLKATTLESSTKKAVRIDNEFFQTYNDKQGKWILPGDYKSSVSAYLTEFETTEEEFRMVNRLKPSESIQTHKPLFFPYGEGYSNKLLSEGKGRHIIVSDHREFIWPIGSPNGILSSKLGQRKNSMHTGIDIRCPMKSPILAASDGIVTMSGFSGNYGLAVQIKHELNQLQTLYAHNSILLVKEGDKVNKGQVIAFSGSTGHSTGPHLHFEVRYQNIVLNPEHYVLSPDQNPNGRFTVLKEEKL
jgi:murein DD-endopeptidase MepM/ murein hydrolase activator NlpD